MATKQIWVGPTEVRETEDGWQYSLYQPIDTKFPVDFICASADDIVVPPLPPLTGSITMPDIVKTTTEKD